MTEYFDRLAEEARGFINDFVGSRVLESTQPLLDDLASASATLKETERTLATRVAELADSDRKLEEAVKNGDAWEQLANTASLLNADLKAQIGQLERDLVVERGIDARTLFASQGFTGESLEIALGVAWVEGDGNGATRRYGVNSVYHDAVGDLNYLTDPVVAAKWGASISHFQIRALRDPNAWGKEDRVRIASELRNPVFATHAPYVISRSGTYWEPWSAFKNKTYLPFKGKDFLLVTGHPRAHLWNS